MSLSITPYHNISVHAVNPPDQGTETGQPTNTTLGQPGVRYREQCVLLTITSEMLVFQASRKAFFVGNNGLPIAVGNVFK